MRRDFSGQDVLELVSEAGPGGARRLRGDLESAFGIRVRAYPDRYILNYSQINSAECRFEPVVRVCRQLIVSRDMTRILHRSFDRFFNIGEDPDSAAFDFSKAVCEEKLDGALVGLYFDGEGWKHCSKSLAYAEGNLNASLKYRTFGELIDAEVDLHPLFMRGNTDFSYIFELTSPWDPHVAHYSETCMHLLAVRDRESGEYVDVDHEAARIGWHWRPREFRFRSRQEILANVRTLPHTEEGYVCRVGSWRVKVKSPAHVAAQSLKDSTVKNETAVIRLVHAHEETEYLSCFPEDEKLFTPWLAVRDAMPAWFEKAYALVHAESRAQMAAKVKETGIPAVLASLLFRMFEKGGDFRHAVNDLKLDESKAVKFYRAFRERLEQEEA